MIKRMFAIVVVLAVLGGGGYYAYERLNAAKTSTSANLSTTTAGTGTLVASVAASGALASPQSGSATWELKGVVGQVNVKVGDPVKEGDVLMTLNMAKLDTSVVQAQATLLADQQALSDLMAPASAEDIANAELTVVQDTQAITTAQRAVNSISKPSVSYYQNQLTLAQNTLTAAQQNSAITDFQTSLKAATDVLTTAANALQSIKDLDARYPGYGSQRDRLLNAQKAYDSAQITYQTELYRSQQSQNNNQVTVADAQAALTTAQANLKAAESGPDAAQVALKQQELTVAQAKLVADQDALTQLKAGPSDSAMTSAKAKIAVDQATLDGLKLVAPFDATVVAINTTTGDAVTPGTVAVELADLRTLQVAVSVSEVDVNRLAVGQEVDLSLDAVSGQTFTGTVSDIGYLGTTTQGVVNYPVTVIIANPDPALKPGMTASAAVITDKKTNVLLVPNRAIHVTGGQRTVTVLFEGQQIPVTVQVGLSNDTQSEITGGQLKDGDTLVLNTTTAASSNGGGFGGGGFGPGG